MYPFLSATLFGVLRRTPRQATGLLWGEAILAGRLFQFLTEEAVHVEVRCDSIVLQDNGHREEELDV